MRESRRSPSEASPPSPPRARRRVLLPRPEETAQAVLAASRHDMDVNVRDALADAVVDRHERPFAPAAHPPSPAPATWRSRTASRSDRRRGRAASRGAHAARAGSGPGTAVDGRGTRAIVRPRIRPDCERPRHDLAERARAGHGGAATRAVRTGAAARRHSRGPGPSDRERSNDRRALRKLSVLDLFNRQRRVLDQRGCRPIAVAAVAEPSPQPREPVLPAGQPRIVGAHVLEEQELAARPQDARDLRQRALGSSTVQRTSVQTTVSNESSSNGSCSAGAGSPRPAGPHRSSLRASRRAIGSSGSVKTISSTASG